jgi:hypothetical protein
MHEDVPHSLTDEHKSTKSQRVRTSIRPIRDKSWVFQYNPETQCESAECRTKLPSKFCLQKPRVRIMLIILIDKQNLIHKESELEGKTTD